MASFSNKKYFVDVDGVVRKFCEAVGIGNQTTWQKLGKDVWNKIDENPEKYLYHSGVYNDVKNWVLNRLEHVVFLTNQNGNSEREYQTRRFLIKHFWLTPVVFVNHFVEKIDLLKKNPSMILIDDYPKFHEKEGFSEVSDRIYLMERPWNEDVRDKFSNFFSEVK